LACLAIALRGILAPTLILAREEFMVTGWSRRNLLKLAALGFPAGALGMASSPAGLGFAAEASAKYPEPVPDLFPTQPPELVRETVLVAHFDLKRVKELVDARPSLARASWDWGFGDWEDALGAASHMGNRPMAEYLISKGARPTLFSAAMLGQLEVVKGFIAAQPGVQRIRGPHGISLLAHAKAGKDAARPVYDFLKSMGDADSDPPVALSESDANAVKGTYVFGRIAGQQIDVTVDRGQTLWTRKGMTGRPLVYLGERVFSPCGAPSVRIRFAEDGGAMVLTITDPDVVLVARRVAEQK
jgi:hypothetical protein